MRVEVVVGNIAKQPDAEALVMSSNLNARRGSGTSAAIHDAAGMELEQYCRRFGKLSYGCAIITPGFRLPNAWVIHATAAPFDLHDSAQHLENALEAVMQLATQRGVKSLAMPGFGIGIFRMPVYVSVEITSKVLQRHAPLSSSIEWVRLCLSSSLVARSYAAGIAEWQKA